MRVRNDGAGGLTVLGVSTRRHSGILDFLSRHCHNIAILAQGKRRRPFGPALYMVVVQTTGCWTRI